MSRKLLLSLITAGAISSNLYAGGDVSEPQAETETKSNDFWGSIGFEYSALKDETSLNKFFKGDDDGNIGVVLGAEKEIWGGFSFGVELGGILNFDIDRGKRSETAEVSQIYLKKKVCNTEIQAGRFELSGDISPLVWSDRTVEVLDTAFNGVTITNSDISDTTLVGA